MAAGTSGSPIAIPARQPDASPQSEKSRPQKDKTRIDIRVLSLQPRSTVEGASSNG